MGKNGIFPARSPKDYDLARELFREYAAWLGIDLGFQDFEAELAGLPGKYTPPDGELFLAYRGGRTAGCIALRPFSGSTGEVKRLWVRDDARGTGLGKKLAIMIVDTARERGYRRLYLDTLATMKPAMHLYTSLGFRPIPAYYDNPHPEARYFAMDLQ
jgi:GNAT superfamily N-acetyltransferase